MTTVITVIIVLVLIGAGAFLFNPSSPDTSMNTPNNPNTDSGLEIEDIKEGSSPTAEIGDTVEVHYVGTLEDGTQFDSSRDRGTPFSFTLGTGSVIAGWDQGLIGMKQGGVRKLVIPPELAYGSQGAGGVIPPNATLMFEIELLAVEKSN